MKTMPLGLPPWKYSLSIRSIRSLFRLSRSSQPTASSQSILPVRMEANIVDLSGIISH